LWIGDATEIARKHERKQKTDRQDAQHILQLLMENRFPKIWVPSGRIGSSATVVASASHGADADPDHESTASGGSERGATLQKEVVAAAWTRATGVVSLSPLGESATEDLLQLLDRLNPTITI